MLTCSQKLTYSHSQLSIRDDLLLPITPMDTFQAIAHPARRWLLEVLADGDRTAGELVAGLPNLSQPSISRHLRILREAGLVTVSADAQRRRYALCVTRLVHIDMWINRLTRNDA